MSEEQKPNEVEESGVDLITEPLDDEDLEGAAGGAPCCDSGSGCSSGLANEA